MKYCFDISPALEEGTGIAFYAKNFLQTIIRMCPEDDIFIGWRPGRGARAQCLCRDLGVGRGRVSGGLLWPLPWVPFFTNSVDVFHSFTPKQPHQRFPRIIQTVHDVYYQIMPDFFLTSSDRSRAFLKRAANQLPRVLEHCVHVITVSDYTRQCLIDLYPSLDPAKITTVHHGIQFEKYQETVKEPPSPVCRQFLGVDYLLHIGSIVRLRNLPRTVSAFARALKGKDRRTGSCSVKLVLLGPSGDDFESVQAEIAHSRVTAEVHCLEFVSEKEKMWLLQNASGLLMFHHCAGFGLPLLEAMAAGIPIAASPVGALPEVAADAAVWASPQDVESMADAITEVLCRGSKVMENVRCGIERSRRMTWDECVRKTMNVYRSLAE